MSWYGACRAFQHSHALHLGLFSQEFMVTYSEYENCGCLMRMIFYGFASRILKVWKSNSCIHHLHSYQSKGGLHQRHHNDGSLSVNLSFFYG